MSIQSKSNMVVVSMDEESMQLLTAAAKLRAISVSDYVRNVAVAQARRDVVEPRGQTILLSGDEQLAVWQALQAPAKLTAAQKRLGKLIRGEE